MTILYPDISHYSWDRHGGMPDWAALKAAGYEAVMIRASYGDPKIYSPATRYFREMAAAARQAGLWVGGYHNLIHGDDASIGRQVAYFKAELDAVGAHWAMVDVEPYDALVINGLWPRLDDAVRFEAEWDRVDTQRRLVIYLARWFWAKTADQHGLGSPDLTVLKGPMVSSNYPASALEDPAARYAEIGGDGGPGWTAYGGKTPTVWQFSSKVTVPGVSDTEDINAFKGTTYQLMAATRKGEPVTWYLNPALTNFRNAVNAAYPNRDKASDGTIGDAAHQATNSDHNPDPDGSVDAWDMDVNLNSGSDAAAIERLKEVFEAHESSRYWIHNRQIASRSDGWVRRYYDGPSAHTEHVHWNTREAYENSTAPWIIKEGVAQLFCRYGNSGDNVRYLQYRLKNISSTIDTMVGTVDGDYGDKTAAGLAAAIKLLNGKVVDGKTYGPVEMIYIDALWHRKYLTGLATDAELAGVNTALDGRLDKVEASVASLQQAAQTASTGTGSLFPATVTITGGTVTLDTAA